MTERERKPEESYLCHYSIPLFLLGKNRPLTHTCPQEEAPLWPPGAGSAAHPVDTKWFWTDTGSMGFRGTCWWKTSSTSTSRSPPGMVHPCVRHARRLFLLFILVGHSTEEGNGNPLQCSCLENPRDGGAWWAAVYGVAQSRTRLKRLSSSSSSSY